MILSLRLAGFQHRDTLMWVFGSGFPKSTAIDKIIDKLFNAEW
jgi:site-specific DNA-methyltransferase (adenine-specific)